MNGDASVFAKVSALMCWVTERLARPEVDALPSLRMHRCPLSPVLSPLIPRLSNNVFAVLAEPTFGFFPGGTEGADFGPEAGGVVHVP